MTGTEAVLAFSAIASSLISSNEASDAAKKAARTSGTSTTTENYSPVKYKLPSGAVVTLMKKTGETTTGTQQNAYKPAPNAWGAISDMASAGTTMFGDNETPGIDTVKPPDPVNVPGGDPIGPVYASVMDPGKASNRDMFNYDRLMGKA